MSSLNTVALVGRLTKDPELRYTPSGMAVCMLRLAVDRAGEKDGEEVKAGYFDVVVWSKQGENCAQYLAKGRQIAVSGSLRFSEWEKDGQKRNKVEINARDVQFLAEPKGEGGGTTAAPRGPAPDDNFQSTDDDIPF